MWLPPYTFIFFSDKEIYAIDVKFLCLIDIKMSWNAESEKNVRLQSLQAAVSQLLSPDMVASYRRLDRTQARVAVMNLKNKFWMNWYSGTSTLYPFWSKKWKNMNKNRKSST